MKKKLPPPMPLTLEALRYEIDGEDKIEKRINLLKKTIRHLYTSGWYYDEVLRYFKDRKLYHREAKYIATAVYTRDQKFNPYGFWYKFKYEFPLEVLHFTQTELKMSSLYAAGYIFTLILLDENKNNVYSILESAIDKHPENEILVKLVSLRSKTDLLVLENPQQFLTISGISNYTRNKITEDINHALGINHELFYEAYDGGGCKKRLWIYDHKIIVDLFNRYRKKNPYVRKLLRKIDNPESGGINIFNMDNLLSKDKKKLTNYYKSFLSTCEDTEHDYYKDCIKKKGDLSLEKLYNIYESLFKYDKRTFLRQSPVDANPFLRIYTKKRKWMIVCQRDFLDYKLLLSTLYGDEKIFLEKMPAETSLNGISLANIRRENSGELLNRVAKLKLRLIIKNIGNHLHPISNPDNPKIWGRHFDQVKAVTAAVDSISNAGIEIDIEKARQLFEILRSKEPFIDPGGPEESEIDEKEDVNNDNFDSEDEEPDPIDLDDFEEDNDEDEDELINKLMKDPERIRHYKNYLLKILGVASNSLNRNNGRIYGQFTPHSAATHRMTCRLINIQGIPKKLKKILFAAPKGKVLLSADISGKDIAVTANIAMKIINDNNLNLYENENTIERFTSDIYNTIKVIQYPKKRPLDFLTDSICEHFGGMDFIPEDDNYNMIKGIVKNYIYATFYGGSSDTFLKSKWKESLTKIIAIINEIKTGEYEYLSKQLKKITIKTNFEEFCLIKSKLEEFYGYDLYIMVEYGHDLEKAFTEAKELYTRYYKIFEDLSYWLDFRLPGLLATLKILEEYSNKNPLYLTYPSLLGWQTPVDEHLPYHPKLLFTRSKSYVIQASGAEFIREWILELTRTELYKKKKFKIVAAIHDQVLIEASSDYEEEVKEIIVKTKDNAAKNVGLIPETMVIPSVEKLYPKDKKKSTDDDDN